MGSWLIEATNREIRVGLNFTINLLIYNACAVSACLAPLHLLFLNACCSHWSRFA